MAALQLIVGLGNPGERYVHTRHNIGFWFIDAMLTAAHGQLKFESKFQGELGKLDCLGETIWVLKPRTFMNLSGDSVAAVCHYYQIDIGECLVVHDDLALPVGEIRVKRGGGHGGHNGLRHISERMGDQFMRLRMGIGHPGQKEMVTPHVLNAPELAEQQQLMHAVNAAVENLPLMLKGDWDSVMHRLHSRKAQ